MVQVEDLKKLEEPESSYKAEKPTLLSKYRIPVQHLEFEYVETCKDGRELEKILLILRSGEEGYFPHLVEATEKQLAVVKPNSKLLRKVCPVLKSSEIEKGEWENLSKDLDEWVGDANKKDQELEDRKATSNEELFSAQIRKTRDIPMKSTAKPSLGRIKSTDYQSWDKYDPDTEILKMDLEDEKMKKEALKKQKESSKTTKTVRFNNFVTEAEAVYEANREKERGNECFKAGEYSNALQHYTNSLECKPLAAVYTNRALIYNKLKKYQMAISDSKLALKLEPRNFKAYLRMAQSYDALKRYNEALESVEMAIEIDPNNSTAQHLAEQVRKECGIVTSNKRFNIRDVDSNDVNNIKTPKPILKNSENSKDDINRSTNSFNNTKLETTSNNTKVLSDKSYKKPLKPILKVENKTEAKSKNSTKASKGFEVISIPGSSKMPPPYYKVVHSNDPRVIKREKQKIFAKPCLLHITTVDLASDDDDLTDRGESTNERHNVSPVKTSKQSSYTQVEKSWENCELESFKFNDKAKLKATTHKTCKNACKRKPIQKIDTQDIIQVENNKAAGGEPCNSNDEDLVPSAEELQSPYTFIETWNSVRKDASYKQHAEILRKLDSERIHQVIGFKLDDTMLSCIINCLYVHFMAPGELDRLHGILTNITQIPRFKMILMFLDESDWQRINQLIQFLDQHGRGLPTNIRTAYAN